MTNKKNAVNKPTVPKANNNGAKKPPKLKTKTGKKGATERPLLKSATGAVTNVEIEELLAKANGAPVPAVTHPERQDIEVCKHDYSSGDSPINSEARTTSVY